MEKKGFTLIELLIVIAILGLLVVLALPAILKVYNNTKINVFVNQAQSIFLTAEEQYVTDRTDGVYVTAYRSNGTYKLKLQGTTDVTYNVEFKNRKISKFKVSQNNYSIELNGPIVTIDEINRDAVIEGEGGGVELATPGECFITDVNEASEMVQMLYMELEAAPSDYLELYYILFGMILPEENEVLIYGYDYENENCSSDIILPEEIDGKTVIGLSGYSFIIFEEEDEEPIGMGITSIILPDSLKTIGFGALAFNQLTDIDLKNVEVVGEAALGLNQLENVTFSSNLMSIGADAFMMNQLTNINISSTDLFYILEGAFQNNYITEGNAKICNLSSSVEIEENAFANNGVDGLTPINPTFTSDICPE